MAAASLPLLVLRLELPKGRIVERMSSAFCDETVEYFSSSGAKRCFDGESISYSVARTNCDRSKIKNIRIGDWRDDPRYEEDDY